LAAASAWSSEPKKSHDFLPVATTLSALSLLLCDVWRYPWIRKVKVLKRQEVEAA